MCGIAGIARREPTGVSAETLTRMAAAIRHRGPDGFGLLTGPLVGLSHVRLSIIDIEGGAQPLANESRRLWVVFNGEIYNYRELRVELERYGHRFVTYSDTEVLVHGYEQWGAEMLNRLNGQFAFALYDSQNESVFLARDRFGVRPLFYATENGSLYFGSEVKALFASGEIAPAPDVTGLDEVFTFWAARAPRTPFRGVYQLEPGSWMHWSRGRQIVRRYYAPRFPGATEEHLDAEEMLDDLMRTSVDFRMRADVPVGGYLSGGLDSSITCGLAAARISHPLRTFSVAFGDPTLDESPYQIGVVERLQSEHATIQSEPGAIGDVFPEVVRHAETPLIRTAAAPLFLLARLARNNGIKVVLTGEGADELFLGYDLFKETKVRSFCLRQPTSRRRPLLFDRLYRYLPEAQRGGELWRRSFLQAADRGDPLFSHLPRFHLASRTKEFYSPDMRSALSLADPLDELRESLPMEFAAWTPLHRAAYLEMTTLLPSYLLSSQGDRMALAHGVEGRFPFLDHRLFEFAAALPERSKLHGLREKFILRRWARRILPDDVANRPKQPYRAPDAPAFFGPRQPSYVPELLEPESLRATGVFDAERVEGLVRRCRDGRATGFRENQAIVAILSTQLWYREFFSSAAPAATMRGVEPDVHVTIPSAETIAGTQPVPDPEIVV